MTLVGTALVRLCPPSPLIPRSGVFTVAADLRHRAPGHNAQTPLVATTGIRYHRGVQYEWDNGKAAENLRKHGVDFSDAVAALEDPNRVEEIDDRFVYGEERSGHRNGT
jgi:hypothetical protein